MEYNVVKANIAAVKASAIVLPANEKLKEGPGASAAIFAAAGKRKLTEACDKIGHCNVGSAVPTIAFDLDASYIIHAVVPKWIDGEHNEYDLLSSAYLSSLTIADYLKCDSIAFPLLASGNMGFDKELAVRIATETIKSFSPTNLKAVTLVIYGDSMELLMRGLGYQVVIIPDILIDDERKRLHKEKQRELLAKVKETAVKLLEEQAAKAIEWIKDPENQEKLFDIAVVIVGMAKQLCKKKD